MRSLKFLAIFALACTGLMAHAETPASGFITYSTNNGSLPPPYRWEITAAIATNGQGTVSYCLGYSDTGCGTAKFQASPETLAALLDAAKTAVLLTHPIQPMTEPPVGGGVTQATVTLDGTAHQIVAFPIAADQPRAATLLTAIAAAIPPAALEQAQENATPVD